MKIKAADMLLKYYEKSPFGNDGGISENTIKFYAGNRFIKVPNLSLRKKLISYHDLHHLITGYSNSRIGEGEVSAWELGSGLTGLHPANFFGFFGLATGLAKSPKRMFRAFIRGRNSRSLIGRPLDKILAMSFEDLRTETLKRERNIFSRLLDWPLCVFSFAVSYFIYPFLVLTAFAQKTVESKKSRL